MSLDIKDRVKVGKFSRDGKNKIVVEAIAHDFGGDFVVPFGIMNVKDGTVDLSIIETKVTEDFIVDRLEEYSTVHGFEGNKKTLVLNTDNGSENHSRRTQFIKRVLDNEEFDIIIVCSENQQHAEVIEAVAAKGIHILTEKPISDNMSGALRIYRTVKNAGVALAINWPSTWFPTVRKAYDVVSAGEIGRIWEFKYRNGPSIGPFSYRQSLTDAEKASEWWYQSKAGGGAFLDYCCYGACLSRWFLGKPAIAAQGLKANLMSQFAETEDNGIVTARFDDAIAIIEGTWSTINVGVPNGPIIYGTEGTLVVDRNKVLVYKERGASDPTKIYEGEPISEHRNNAAKEFIHHLSTGEPLHPTMDISVNLDAMSILDTGIRSAKNGKTELINNVNWSIG